VKPREHWEKVYDSAGSAPPPWAQPRPSPSLEWILEFLPYRKVRILDVGAGTSPLVDNLLAAGYQRPAVLDISPRALELTRERLGDRREWAQWIETDVTSFRASTPFGLWHDRGLFHYLTERAERRRYVNALRGSLLPGGLALIATYAPGTPDDCTGLPVAGYDAAALAGELGQEFRLRISQRVVHQSALGERQEYTYCIFERV
jgi:SAM-dependent methyltransferase